MPIALFVLLWWLSGWALLCWHWTLVFDDMTLGDLVACACGGVLGPLFAGIMVLTGLASGGKPIVLWRRDSRNSTKGQREAKS